MAERHSFPNPYNIFFLTCFVCFCCVFLLWLFCVFRICFLFIDWLVVVGCFGVFGGFFWLSFLFIVYMFVFSVNVVIIFYIHH